jgi:hypothetical protein
MVFASDFSLENRPNTMNETPDGGDASTLVGRYRGRGKAS